MRTFLVIAVMILVSQTDFYQTAGVIPQVVLFVLWFGGLYQAVFDDINKIYDYFESRSSDPQPLQ